jgi:hypothetical protein
MPPAREMSSTSTPSPRNSFGGWCVSSQVRLKPAWKHPCRKPKGVGDGDTAAGLRAARQGHRDSGVYTPNVVLGAIIIAAVIGLIDLPAVYHIWKMDKMDFLVCLCAFPGVIFISVQEGLAIAVTNRIVTKIQC